MGKSDTGKINKPIRDALYSVSVAVHKLFHKNGVKQAKLSSNKTMDTLFIFAMLAIPIVHFLVFWLYVNFDSLLLSFRRIDIDNGGYYFTFQNFIQAWNMITTSGDIMQTALSNTLATWAFGLFIQFPLSFFLTVFIYKKVLGNKIFIIFMFLPGMFSSVALGYLYSYFINPEGPVGYMLLNYFGLKVAPQFLSTPSTVTPALIFYLFYFGLPGNMLLFLGGMNRIPKEMLESACLDGCCFAREIFNFIIPLTWPTISTLIVFQVAGIFGAGGPVIILTANIKESWTIGYWQYKEVVELNNFFVPSAIGLMFTLVAMPIVLIVKHYVNKIFADVEY